MYHKKLSGWSWVGSSHAVCLHYSCSVGRSVAVGALCTVVLGRSVGRSVVALHIVVLGRSLHCTLWCSVGRCTAHCSARSVVDGDFVL